MLRSVNHPISDEPFPAEGTWQWAIRKHGKLIQRSDRAQPSEAKAWAQEQATIEKLLHGGDEGHY